MFEYIFSKLGLNESTSDKIRHFLNSFGMLFILLALVILISVLTPNFLTTRNLLTIIRQISIIAIVGFGVTFIIITTGIDLASGSVIALVGVVTASLAHPDQFPIWVPVVAGLAVGALTGLVSGTIVAIGRIPAFIATLGMMIGARAAALIFSDGRPITGFTDAFEYIGSGYLFKIPIPIFVLALAFFVSHMLLRRTRFGKYVYAVGGSEHAAVTSGINVPKVLILVYTFGGLMAGLAGVVLASRISAGQPTAAVGYELDAIAGVVIGGTSLSGGIGTITGTLIGALIIGVLNNGLDLLHVSAYWQQVVKAFIIVGAVLLDKKRNK